MSYSALYKPEGIEYHNISSFEFHNGDTRDVRVAYRVFNKDKAEKVALVPTCYGGIINQTLNFSGHALKDYKVIVVAMLGNGESTSPSMDEKFPKKLFYQDCINSQYDMLTKGLGIKQLDVVIGFSMGGQQSYYWPTMYPDFVKNAVCICGSARTSGHNWAFLEGPKAALLNSSDYNDGNYKATGKQPTRGLKAFGRAYAAWLFSHEWFRQETWKKSTGKATLEECMASAWEVGWDGWDAEDVLILANMWQAGDIGTCRSDGSYESALASIKANMLVMPCRTDQYFPPEDSEIEMKYLKHGKFAPIESIWGHVAGGGANPPDIEFMDKTIAEFLKA